MIWNLRQTARWPQRFSLVVSVAGHFVLDRPSDVVTSGVAATCRGRRFTGEAPLGD